MIEFLRSQACLLVDGCDMHIIPYKGNSGHYRVQERPLGAHRRCRT